MQINLQGYMIPYVNDRYRCSFGDIHSHKVTSIQSQAGGSGPSVLIQCVSPPKNKIPKLTSGQGKRIIRVIFVFSCVVLG